MKQSKTILYMIISAVFAGLSRYDLPFDFLIFFAFIPVFKTIQIAAIELKNRKIKDIIKFSLIHGSIYSIVFLTISVSWISIVTLPGFIGILLLYSVYYSLFFLILIWGISRYKKIFASFIIFGFVGLEFALSYGAFKFPWLNIGYSLSHSIYLMQVLEYGGIYLLSFLILLINYYLYMFIYEKRQYRFILIPVIIMAVWWSFGYYRYHNIKTETKDISVGIVQVSIPQEIKWEASFIDSTIDLYQSKTLELLEKEPVDLVIYPEAAIPVYLMNEGMYLSNMLRFANFANVNIFAGFPHYVRELKYKNQPEPYIFFNASNQFQADMKYDIAYFKNQLVPFGERTPFLDRFPILWKLQLGQANFEPGGSYGYYRVRDLVYSPLICYEVVFPNYVRKMMDKKVDFIVNITNDAWFKRSVGTYQHKMMCVFRSIESRKSLFRSANTGYSIVVNPRGDIVKELGLYEKGAISSKVEIYNKPSFYHQFGFIFPYFILFLFLIEFSLTIFKKNVK
ncbi:MAG: apolipoprotein N-acyltransferase [Candidatus Cloacimonetes bacterium]|nr:apolipoprotein N-acyltransferase [Candidatus Cloacimonadota bacterium]